MNTVSGSRLPLLLAASCFLVGCSGVDRSAPETRLREAPAVGDQLFTQLPSSYTGVRFENRLADTRELNVFTYRNYYNGGGVALGDLTGDGLPELLLTSNLGANRLYLNEGDFRFTDVTERAGVAGKGFWATGSPSPTSTVTDSSTSTSATPETWRASAGPTSCTSTRV